MTIIILIIAIILIIVIWLLSFLFSGSTPAVPGSNDSSDGTFQVLEDEETISEKMLEKEQEVRDSSAGVISVSKTFVERYGSYSNEANFSNITDVLPVMTERFAKESQKFVEGATAPEGHYGVTTRVITVKINSLDEEKGNGSALITTQREESKDPSGGTEVRYQDIELKFEKEAGVWKVDSANWQ